MRVSSSGDQMDGVGHLRDAEGEPRRMVVAVGLGVAGNDADDELCGCRSSGELGLVARGHGEVRGVVLRVPGDAVSALDMVVWPLGGWSIVGEELGGGACGEASCGRYGAREREREGWGGS